MTEVGKKQKKSLAGYAAPDGYGWEGGIANPGSLSRRFISSSHNPFRVVSVKIAARNIAIRRADGSLVVARTMQDRK